MSRLIKWKTIDGYTNYQISDIGEVRSKDVIIVTANFTSYIKKGKLFSPKRHKDGYLFVQLTKNKKRTNHYIHRLVANAFIENTNQKLLVNHIDGNKRNNCFENLEWVTSQENALHAYKNNLLYRIGDLKHMSQAVINTSTGECFSTIKEAAIALNRNYTVIREMLKGKRGKTLPLKYCDCCL